MAITPVQRITTVMQPIHTLLPDSVQPASESILDKIKSSYKGFTAYDPCLPEDKKCAVITREVFRKIGQTFLMLGCATAVLAAALAALALAPFVGLMAGFSLLSEQCLNKHLIIGTPHKPASQAEIHKYVGALKDAGRPVKSLTIHCDADVTDLCVPLAKIKLFSPEKIEIDQLPASQKAFVKENLCAAGYTCDDKDSTMEFTKQTVNLSKMQKVAEWVKKNVMESPGTSFDTPLPTDSKVAIFVRGCMHAIAKAFRYISIGVGSLAALGLLVSAGSSLAVAGFNSAMLSKLGDLIVSKTVVIADKKGLDQAGLEKQLKLLIEYHRPVKIMKINGAEDNKINIDKSSTNLILQLEPQTIELKHAMIWDKSLLEKYSFSKIDNRMVLEKNVAVVSA